MTVRPDEDTLAEQPAIEVLKHLNYAYTHGEELTPSCPDRDTLRDVVLVGRLKAALRRLNPWIDEANLAAVIHRLTEIQTADLMEANEEVRTLLVQGLSREQEVKGKKGHHTVKLIDWEKPENNDFLVVNQFEVRGDEDKRPDIVVFVNGLPLAVIECKAPGLADPKVEGVQQVRVYQSICPRLFWANHFLVVAAGSAGAWYGAIGSPGEYFFEWKTPWPATMEDIACLIGRTPTPQDVLLVALFEKGRFLDHLRNFVVFDREKTGTVKKLPRYQQFNAVNKALDRIAKAKTPKERGGVVWHTQGSGKSLTMVWLAVKLRRLGNPTICIVTDRTDLDRQISGVYQNCGLREFAKTHRARTVADLREQLSGPRGLTISTTIQKFQEDRVAEDERIPLLSDSPDIFVLVDEAHRTNYRALAANMRTALPNATFLGFTGTPIDKKDRQTHKTFGSYIDTYTIQQAVDDHATVPILYEGRLPELRVEGGESLDALFNRFFADKTDKERAEIKKRYAIEEAIASAPDRINKITLDILEHFEKHIVPNGFKAQIVAVNREAAVLYKARLDELNGPESAVVISVDHNDTDPRIKACKRTKEQQEALIKRFLDKTDPLKILVVCDMLLTGFDAPVEQVMYLDRGLKEHNLLQAIARVNRLCGPDKSYGLIVDYWGVSSFLEQALAIFTKADVQGALTPWKDELPTLQAFHARAMQFFSAIDHRHGRFDTEAQASDVVERCVQVLAPDDRRAEFLGVFKRLSQSFDRVLPDPAANPYRDDLKLLGIVVKAARTRYRDDQLNLEGCGEKVRRLINEHVRAVKIELLVEPVPILAPDFDRHLDKLRSPRARASEMEHAIRHEIRIKVDEDPAFYQSLREKLEQIIAARKEERLSDKDEFDRLRVLIDEARSREQVARSHDMDEREFAFYGLLAGRIDGDLSKKHRALAKEMVELLSEKAVIDWETKTSVQKEMRRDVKRLLRVAEYAGDEIDALATRVLDLAKTKLRTKA